MAVPTQLAFRTVKGIGLLDAAPIYAPPSGFEAPEGKLRCQTYSPDGRYFAWASPDKVRVVDAATGLPVTNLNAADVHELGFSPLGTYIITWQRPSKDDNGDAVKNLKVWRLIENGSADDDDEHTVVGRFVQKSQTGWNLQYTPDEKYCARAVTNEIQFYESHDLRTVWSKLHVEGVTDFAISPGSVNSIAVFVPERKGMPAAVKVFNVPNFTAPVSQKTFFKGDKVQLKWNNHGTSLIVLAQTEVDKSGKSYYGETMLYLISANGGFDSRIDLDREGAVHEVSWSPNSKEFGVVYGRMPAKTTIFNLRAQAVHSFALSPRNTILFSPHGRFVLVAGFGNLAGEVDIYDLEKDYQKVCSFRASDPSVCEWSPDGQYIMMATTTPRLRVDNGIRLWHVSGSLMYNEDMIELYNVAWRPQSIDTHPLRDPIHNIPAPHSSALTYLGTVKTPSKPVGAYRPPGARGTMTPLAFMREDQGGSAHVSDGSFLSTGATPFGARRRSIPGAEPAAVPGAVPADTTDDNLSAAALKNKKKREAKKAKAASEKTTGLFPSDGMPVSPSLNRNGDGRDRRDGRSRSRTGERRDGGTRRHDGDVRRNEAELHPRSENRDRSSRGTSRRREGASDIKSPSKPVGVVNGKASAPKQNDTRGLKPTAEAQPKSPTTVAPPLSLNTIVSKSAAAAPDLTVTTPGGGGSPAEKKIRALTKKLRAIDDLKLRRAGGEALEVTQMKKMETEESVRKELESLGWQD